MMEQHDMPTQRIRERVAHSRAIPDSKTYKVEGQVQHASPQVTAEAEHAHSKAVDVKVEETEVTPMTWERNTTYLVCPEVHQVHPPSEGCGDANAPQRLSFLIPPEALGSPSASTHYTDRAKSKVMLEVSCDVVGVTPRALQELDHLLVPVSS